MILFNSFRLPPWVWLIPLLSLWFALALGNRPFASPDEGRYVEIPREMAASGDYITPRLNGVKYFEKPPLFYWLQAISIKAFGIQEAAMRLWCVFFAVLGCMGTYFAGRWFYNPQAGLAACLILAASPLYYALSRLIILDMAVTAFVSLSLAAFLATIHTPAGLQRRLWAYAFYGCSALGVLTKGLMALAIPGPVILIWVFSAGRWKDLWPAYLPSGILVFLAIAAPWHIMAALENSDFLHKYFVVEHWMRYTTSVHMRTKPFWFFVPTLLLGLFPWVSLLWGAIRNGLKTQNLDQRDITLFLLVWIGWTFGFFSLANSKLIPYILPCFPPIALILGDYWVKIALPAFTPQWRQAILTFAGATATLGVVGMATLLLKPNLIDHRPHLWFDFTILASLLLVLSGAASLCLYRKWVKLSLAAIPLAAVVLVAAVIRLMPELQRPSVKPLAEMILSLKEPDDIVGCYKAYYQDLPVYLQQTITVVEARGELEFGCEAEDCSRWMMNEASFLNLWKGNKRLFFIARRSEFEALARRIPEFIYITLAENQGNVLVTNQKK
jgi:4-amino-4-deoxy-L-arabinose transferase-like glycosyltransferase